MFETRKSGNKTSSGEIGLNIRTLASPKVGQDHEIQSIGTSVLHLFMERETINLKVQYGALNVNA